MKHVYGFSAMYTGLLFFSLAFAQPDTLWSSTIDVSKYDSPSSVINTPDGYIIAGYTSDMSYNNDYMVFKVDLNGSLLWSNLYSDPALEFEFAAEVIEAPEDNEYYIFGHAQVVGTPYTDLRILRIDGDGTLLEEKMFGEPNEDFVVSAAATSDDGYIIVGCEGIYPSFNIFLLKLDSQLNTEWRRSYFTSTQNPSVVIQTSDGGFLVAGTTEPSSSNSDCYLLKTDHTGVVEFETDFGSPIFDRIEDIIEVDEGSYMGLWAKNDPSPYSTVLVKLDSQGAILWENEHMGGRGNQMLINSDGTIVVTGVNAPDMWLMCADTLGNELWETRLNAGTLNHVGLAICPNGDGGYLVAAATNPAAGEADVWLLNFDSYTGIVWQNSSAEGLWISSIRPNPSASSVFMDFNMPVPSSALISIFDIAGRRIDSFQQYSLPAGINSFCWTPDETLLQGCYTVMIETSGYTASQPCVILR